MRKRMRNCPSKHACTCAQLRIRLRIQACMHVYVTTHPFAHPSMHARVRNYASVCASKHACTCAQLRIRLRIQACMQVYVTTHPFAHPSMHARVRNHAGWGEEGPSDRCLKCNQGRSRGGHCARYVCGCVCTLCVCTLYVCLKLCQLCVWLCAYIVH